MDTAPKKPRVLVFSQRNTFKGAHFRCSPYEFEDVISKIDSAEVLAPQVDVSSLRYRLAKRVAFHSPVVPLLPERNRIKLEADYELFVAICSWPTDLLLLETVGNWRDRCKTAVCVMDELWVKGLNKYHNFFRILQRFDVVMLYSSGTVGTLKEQIGRKCLYLPPGVDAVRFCPYPGLSRKVVDVYSIGRRSETTHRSLLRMVDEEGIFYLHDSISGFTAINATEHRSLLANIAKKSRYFIVNPARIDQPEIRGDQIEFGNRYFDGSAAGAILLGERPTNDAFDKLFDWPDAVIDVPFNSSEIDEVIHELDLQPERQMAIQRANVTQALLRHDWVYRWESILEAVNLEAMPELSERKDRLRGMAEVMMATSMANTTHYRERSGQLV